MHLITITRKKIDVDSEEQQVEVLLEEIKSPNEEISVVLRLHLACMYGFTHSVAPTFESSTRLILVRIHSRCCRTSINSLSIYLCLEVSVPRFVSELSKSHAKPHAKMSTLFLD